jgi:hypothetical protein
VRQRYGATVLAIFRIDEVIDSDLPEFVLQAGDTLVLHCRWRDIAPIAENNDFAVVTDFPRDDTRPHKLPYATGFFLLALSLILFSDLRLSVALMTGAVGMMRMLGVFLTASVGWMVSVITSSFNGEAAMRATAPPESTPWVM